MAYETLIIEHEEPILIIKLNRPNALNALNSKLLEELNSALTDAENNDSVRTIILTGSEKAFAAGADIKEMISKSFVDMFYKNFFSKSKIFLGVGAFLVPTSNVKRTFFHALQESGNRLGVSLTKKKLEAGMLNRFDAWKVLF